MVLSSNAICEPRTITFVISSLTTNNAAICKQWEL